MLSRRWLTTAAPCLTRRTLATSTQTQQQQQQPAVDPQQDAVYAAHPAPLPRPHGHVVANLHFRSFLPDRIDFYARFALRVAHALGIPASNPARLPTRIEKWTVPKSSFVHKKAQEQFERRHHKRLVQLYDADDEVVRRLVWYLGRNIPAGVGIRVERFRMVGVTEAADVAVHSSGASALEQAVADTLKELEAQAGEAQAQAGEAQQ